MQHVALGFLNHYMTNSESFTYTAISIKVIPEQSGKVEYERERLLGIAKIH
jgi:hypothetical protein